MQEFDVAFHHNVMVKRKKRLIVLMALDSPNDLHVDDAASDTSSLRQYLRQYTYIDFASEDWLDRLLYALPPCGMNHPAGGDEQELSQHHQDPVETAQQPAPSPQRTDDDLPLLQ